MQESERLRWDAEVAITRFEAVSKFGIAHDPVLGVFSSDRSLCLSPAQIALAACCWRSLLRWLWFCSEVGGILSDGISANSTSNLRGRPGRATGRVYPIIWMIPSLKLLKFMVAILDD